MTSPILSLAICGVGRFGERRVLPALADCSDIRLGAVISRSRTSFAFAGNDVPVWPSLDAFLAARPSGALYILTPNALHAPQAVGALTAGLDVLCEKPMATRAIDCWAMVNAARAAGRHLQIAHVLRDSAAMQELQRLIADGRIGRVQSATATVNFDLSAAARSWIDDDAMAGGGVLMDLGVHCVDLCHWLFDGNLAPVSAVLEIASGAETETGVRAEFTAGLVACTLDLHNGRPYSSRLVIAGDQGRIEVEHFTASWGDAVIECHDAAGRTERHSVGVGASYRAQLEGFARRLRIAPDYRQAEAAAEGVALVENLYDMGRRLS